MSSRVDTRVVEQIQITGLVQGVGFRPFVHRLATELGLDGRVGNDSTRVFVEAAGQPSAIDEFARRIVSDAPPLAHVEQVTRQRRGSMPAPGFQIAASESVDGPRTLIPPDTAPCPDCRRELFDPGDRRYRHAFITCTNCGPRFTIITGLPYDRPSTTMAEFTMCDTCRSEYEDPADRRYHAQPIACHDCGPTLTYHDFARTRAVGRTALESAQRALAEGRILAVKGVGGFHLVCDASRAEAVAALRQRKHRPDKPLAVMAADIEQAARIANVSESDEATLRSAARPIVLLGARADSAIPELVNPGNPLVGVMLPYSPLHELLFDGGPRTLVATSGNVADAPLIFRDDDIQELRRLADAVLTHDRAIAVPCDDSVVRLVGGRLMPLRRGRGYAPIPVGLPRSRRSALATGGELKNTFCVASGNHAWVSQHIGDMGNLGTLETYEAAVAQLLATYDVRPDVIAVDSHPGYLVSKWARRRWEGVIEVQHHHAHVASVMAEHRLDPGSPVIGFAFDGTGYGEDGTIWGGEVVVADASSCDRYSHLLPIPLPGGDAAIENPYRVALSHLRSAGIEWSPSLAPVVQMDGPERRVLERQLETGFGCVPTTSVGRFFDAIASLLGIRHRITYEAQAAIELEAAAARAAGQAPTYRFDTTAGSADPAPLLAAVVGDLNSGVDRREIARGVHVAVGALILELALRARQEHGINVVALSGGVFQNALLVELTLAALETAGFQALTNRVVPPNDGGLALGQAYIAAHQSNQGA